MDRRIKALHQKNHGVSSARNLGLEGVKGNYFTFLDADDILLPNSLSYCTKALEDGGYDGVCFVPLSKSFRVGEELRAISTQPVVISPVLDRMTLLWGESGEYGFSCGRVYRTSKFVAVRFPVGMKMCEDAWHWIESITIPARWCMVNRPMIGYRQVEKSASNTFDPEFNRCIWRAYEHTCEVLRKFDYDGDEPMMLFWDRHGAAMCHHLRLLFRDWKTFSQEDKRDLAERVSKIPLQMGWNPFAWHMRLRIAALKTITSANVVLPILYFLCDWLWPRIIRRLRFIRFSK